MIWRFCCNICTYSFEYTDAEKGAERYDRAMDHFNAEHYYVFQLDKLGLLNLGNCFNIKQVDSSPESVEQNPKDWLVICYCKTPCYVGMDGVGFPPIADGAAYQFAQDHIKNWKHTCVTLRCGTMERLVPADGSFEEWQACYGKNPYFADYDLPSEEDLQSAVDNILQYQHPEYPTRVDLEKIEENEEPEDFGG